MNSIDLYISKKFKKARKEFGFTQQDIADILGCSRINVIRMERGQNGFTSKNIYILSAVFQCSPCNFFPMPGPNNKYLKKAKSILKSK